jgi:gliding motility-associated-like protein
MIYPMRKWLRAILVFTALISGALHSYASHIFGVDLFYTHVSGNTYTINLVIYGDCSGAAFPSLSTSTPVIDIYNGATYVTAVTLAVQAPATGVEVTPVCPADSALTTCHSLTYTIPGVKKFVYSANVTLTTTSTVWRFLFLGNMGGTSSAGRSNSITNIVIPSAGSMIELVDTLNNTTFDNSNAIYTTIPTPFFCLDVPANFNPGAVDPNGDSLAFFLVPAMDASTGTTVTYATGYSATAPLGVTTGTFSFSNTTGQLSFTPNILQKSLVVYNVEEYGPGGVFHGTSQREMTVVVLTCTDIPPTGSMSSPSAGTLVSGTSLEICDNAGAFNFHINPTDPDHNNITMTVAGLPTGATVSIVGNGTLAPLATFSWSTTGVAPGTYIFYVTYQDDGCPLSGKQTIAYTIVVEPLPTETYTPVSSATCVAKAVFHVTPGAATSPWTVSAIEGGATVLSVAGVTGVLTDSLSPGTYTIRTTNPYNCYVDTTITITAPSLPIPSVVTDTPSCPGTATGSATISATGGLPSYVYAIGTGAFGTSGAFTGLTPGTYTLHVRDANYCVKDTVVTVPNATPILSDYEIHSPLCDTFSNGFVVVRASNSVAPYTYAIGSGAFSSVDTFKHLAAGTYTFHIKNANSCIVDTTITLTDSESVHASISIASILCNGGTGTITVAGTGGYGPGYTYAYGTGAFGASGIFTLSAGTYTFHVHDPQSCYFDTSLTLTQPTVITATTSVTNVLCNSAATGAITISAAGGTPSYAYDINGSSYGSSASFSGLTAGRYGFSVEDANGCFYFDSVTVTQPSAIVIDSVSLHQPSCNAGTNGSATMHAAGGTGTLTYAVGTGAYGTSATFTGLAAGTYALHVRDANGCEKDTTVTLGQPSAIVPAVVVRPSVCLTLANGSVTLSATGGTSPYTYATGTGTFGTAPLFSPLAAGTYTFHIKDANGCLHDTSLTVTDSLYISSTSVITAALCYGQSSGKIVTTGTGGASPYDYAISTHAYGTSGTFTGLHAGTDTIRIKDANGCINDTIITVGQAALIVPSLSVTPPSCYGFSDGHVTISIAGGTPAFNYTFDDVGRGTTTTYDSLGAGADSIYMMDANGCIHDTVFHIGQPSAIYFADVQFTDVPCFGGTNGTITVSGTGATPPYNYMLNVGSWQSSGSFSGLSAGLQLIRLEDANGCEIDTNVTLTQPSQLIIASADTTNPTCPGYTDGAITLHVSGGVVPYSYSDDGSAYAAANAFIKLAAGAYTIYVHDSNGCSVDTTITLIGLPQIIIDSANVTPPLCFSGIDGSIRMAAAGGVQPLTFVANPSAVSNTTGLFSGLSSGIYLITIKDSRNCFVDTAVLVTQPDSITITKAVTGNDCQGTSDKGIVSVTITGGTAPYTYLWSTNPVQTTSTISGLANGTYSLLVTDANNCTDTTGALVQYDNCCTPFIPNAFTPNDDGNDDIFRLRDKGDMFIVVFSVYNRYGQLVFTETNTSDLNTGWDGRFNGIKADVGTYYYYAKIICGNKGNHTVELKGDVTLIR